ncbi:hypothetical protein D9613_004718 [Agrocybe pediades]|uniref:Fungal-type protein kinase domain-containing protein n=1 Tax=Agrocybe pediades TaxID=84607 RepID=A0A8H4QZM7_9AGAR|nr:hypothetical protein D9613_004718 [Agrocybe pediades]
MPFSKHNSKVFFLKDGKFSWSSQLDSAGRAELDLETGRDSSALSNPFTSDSGARCNYNNPDLFNDDYDKGSLHSFTLTADSSGLCTTQNGQRFVNKPTRDLWTNPDSDPEPKRTYTRLVVHSVGNCLESSRSSRDAIRAVYDAFKVHREVREKLGMLHQDIGLGTILISRDGHGLLVDWDLADPIDTGASHVPVRAISASPRISRPATWQYTSTLLLFHRRKPFEHQDALESFLWVILFISMRFLPGNNIPKPSLSRRIAYIFDSKEYGSSTSSNKDKEESSKPALGLGRVRGGLGKTKFLGVFGVPPGRKQFAVQDNKPMTDLIESFRRVVCMHIQAATLAMAAANRNMRGGNLLELEKGRRQRKGEDLNYPLS